MEARNAIARELLDRLFITKGIRDALERHQALYDAPNKSPYKEFLEIFHRQKLPQKLENPLKLTITDLMDPQTLLNEIKKDLREKLTDKKLIWEFDMLDYEIKHIFIDFRSPSTEFFQYQGGYQRLPEYKIANQEELR